MLSSLVRDIRTSLPRLEAFKESMRESRCRRWVLGGRCLDLNFSSGDDVARWDAADDSDGKSRHGGHGGERTDRALLTVRPCKSKMSFMITYSRSWADKNIGDEDVSIAAVDDLQKGCQ